MSISTHPTVKVVNASEVDYAAGVRAWTEDARDLYRVTMQVVWANYTGVTVKLQGTLDNMTWADLPGMAVSTSGNIVSGEIGPYEQIGVHVTGTLSGGVDTLKVYLKRSRLQR